MVVPEAFCLLALLSVNLGEATEMNMKVLFNVVDWLQGLANKEHKMTNKQIGVLMALSPAQCINGENIEYAHHIYRYPDGTCCESQILLPPKNPPKPNPGDEEGACCSYKAPSPQQTPAATYGKEVEKAQTLKDGGCVIFYTTNTPCISRCFSTNQNWDIVPHLMQDAPFANWRNLPNVDMYFVYKSQPYYEEIIKKHSAKFPSPTQRQAEYGRMKAYSIQGFSRLSGDPQKHWRIARCYKSNCKACGNNYCLSWPDINWAN